MEFEGHEGLTSAPPSNGNQHWARAGVNATLASGNGSLPSGHPTFSKNEGEPHEKTTSGFVQKYGG